jgi:hypothetical protein
MEAQREKGMQFISPALMQAEVGGAIARRMGDPKLSKILFVSRP